MYILYKLGLIQTLIDENFFLWLLRLGLNDKRLGRVYGRFQVQVPIRAKVTCQKIKICLCFNVLKFKIHISKNKNKNFFML